MGKVLHPFCHVKQAAHVQPGGSQVATCSEGSACRATSPYYTLCDSIPADSFPIRLTHCTLSQIGCPSQPDRDDSDE